MADSKLTHHTFELEFSEMHGRHGRVLMDGVELKGVTDVQLIANVDSVVDLQLTLLPAKVVARLTDPKVTALVAQLFAETTSMPADTRTYAPAEAI
jgi:hypothetical protein